MESFVVVFDLFVVVVCVLIARKLRRPPKRSALENWKPSADDARSGRRFTLFVRPKDWRRR
jgi:hypothetical protein